MKKTTRILRLFIALTLVLLPMHGVMANISVVPEGPEMPMVGHHTDTSDHGPTVSNMHHKMLADVTPQADNQSSDCHGHNMSDCDACAIHIALKEDSEISETYLDPTSYTDYSVPVVTLVLSSKNRPPITSS